MCCRLFCLVRLYDWCCCPFYEQLVDFRTSMKPGNDSSTVTSLGPQTTRKLPFHNPGNLNLILNISLHRFFTFPNDYFLNTTIRPEYFAEVGFYMAHNLTCLCCYFCDLRITDWTEWLNLTPTAMCQKHVKETNCNIQRSISNVPMGDTSSLIEYKFEAHRLFSLLSNFTWTVVTAVELASSGFYYAGSDDNCRCVFCKLEVRGWEPNDTADGEHRRWNPNCVFLQDRSSVKNIKIGDELAHDAEAHSLRCATFASMVDFQKYGNYLNVRKLGFIITPLMLGIYDWGRCKYPKFDSLLARRNSFRDWPRSLSQDPLALSNAGFFYTGIGDRVICFFCGIGLKDWDRKDGPMEQHVKWSSSCEFIIMTKGFEFIKQMLASKFIGQQTNFSNDLEMVGVKEKSTGQFLCKKCLLNGANIANLPCGHITFCENCAEEELQCTTCKIYKDETNCQILGSIKIHIS